MVGAAKELNWWVSPLADCTHPCIFNIGYY